MKERQVYQATARALHRLDRITVPVGSRGTQAAIVSHVSRSGTVYACKWLNRGGRWTPPRPLYQFLGHGHGKIRVGPNPPIRS